MWVYASLTPDETFALGERIGRHLPGGNVIALDGNLGAGKTLLIKGLAKGAADIDPEVVQSPTFVHLNIYEGAQTIYHFDLYRLRDSNAFLSMGFDEYLFAGGICCIEWAERIQDILPPEALRISLTHLIGDCRRVEMPLTQAALIWGQK